MAEPNVENAKPVPIRIIKIEFAKFVELSPIFQEINCQIAIAPNKNTRKIIDEIVLIRPIFSISSSSKTSSSSGFSFSSFEMVNLLNSLSKVKIGIEIAKPIIREIPAAKPELSIPEFEVAKNAAAEIPAKSVKIPIARQIALFEIRAEYSFLSNFRPDFFEISPRSSLELISKTLQISATLSISGSVFPLSHAEIDCLETPIFSASCSCDKSCSIRNFCRFLLNFINSFRLIYYTRIIRKNRDCGHQNCFTFGQNFARIFNTTDEKMLNLLEVVNFSTKSAKNGKI